MLFCFRYFYLTSTITFIATVGIVLAQIIRRTQMLELNEPDPFPVPGWNYSDPQRLDAHGRSKALSSELLKEWEEVDTIQNQNHALLRLVYILEQGTYDKHFVL